MMDRRSARWRQRWVDRPIWSRLLRIIAFVRRAPSVQRPQPYGPLSVGALIEQLERFDPDMKVIMPGAGIDWTQVHEAHLDIFTIAPEAPDDIELADDGDPDAILVVRLFGSPD
jgi:hypothetical protein